MANWYGTSRSNYFRVKDAEAFLKWADERGLGVFKHQHDEGVSAIHGGASAEDGSWPSYDMEEEEDEDIDLIDELAAHLYEDQIAVLMEIGAEKLRYLTGVAIAFNSKGATVELILSDVFRTAAQTFHGPESTITRAEY